MYPPETHIQKRCASWAKGHTTKNFCARMPPLTSGHKPWGAHTAPPMSHSRSEGDGAVHRSSSGTEPGDVVRAAGVGGRGEGSGQRGGACVV